MCEHAGLSTGSNQFMQTEMEDKEQRKLLLQYSDQLRLSMAGNLQDYQLENSEVNMHRPKQDPSSHWDPYLNPFSHAISIQDPPCRLTALCTNAASSSVMDYVHRMYASPLYASKAALLLYQY